MAEGGGGITQPLVAEGKVVREDGTRADLLGGFFHYGGGGFEFALVVQLMGFLQGISYAFVDLAVDPLDGLQGIFAIGE